MSISTAAEMPLKPVEGRAVWVDANSIPADDESMAVFVDSLAQANFNVLLSEVIRRGYTIYPSKLDEQDPKWKGYDPVASLVREAHKRGMEVHPWVWVFRQGYSQDNGPIFRAHPDWLAVNKWGETLSANGGLWVCPSIPAARDYLLSLFKELVSTYKVDGLHLDYVRFENQFPAPYCYNSTCRDKFKAEHGVDPLEIDSLSETQVTWHLWREDLVNTFVRQVNAEIRAINPDLKISAAVGSLPDSARESILQNWPHWVDNKWLDFVTPMAYTNSSDKFRKMLSAEKIAVGDRTIVMPGIGLHTHPTLELTLEQIGIARELSTNGATLFATAHLKPGLAQALASGPFPNKSEVPFRKPGERVKTLLESALEVFSSDPDRAASYLDDASSLLGYLVYLQTDVGYVQPSRPPIFIPETVLPMPTAEVVATASAPVIDGRLDDPVWASARSFGIIHTEMGNPAPVETEIRLAYDSTSLYIAYESKEPTMDRLKATVTKRDGPTFYDDSAEIFLDPWNKRHEYYQLAANTLGTQFDAKVNNAGVNLEWQSSAAKSEDGWTMEIAIPFSSLDVKRPAPGDIWAANFGRNRWVTREPQYLIWSVPYGSFHRPERFGSIVFK
ncbi:MAG: family 10 glycosylhydrolase [Armatimonadetes bacterium]|nr:family 10 glycosylhydrolase [Armatimonadota bacterium]